LSKRRGGGILGSLQRIGKSLMLPIAVLPAAGILLRLGALLSDPKYFAKGSIIYYVGEILTRGASAITDHMPVLFAVGVAIGLAEEAGAAALAALVGYLVLSQVVDLGSTKTMKLDTGVLGGIISGAIAAVLYRRYHKIKLPDWLQFFGGKRFVPIITSFVMVWVGIIFLFIWPTVQDWINSAGNWLIGAGAVGVFVYGILNRLLIPFGLHHIVNTIVWFNVGSYHGVTGDMNRFLHGDPTAGIFMAGMFPIMMFALPAACFAMLHEARPSQRQKVYGVLVSAALTAFLTGVTEPIEFSFMFVAPILYVVHAILTGVSMAVVDLLGIRHGFTFSAGAIDYILNYNLATKPLLLLVIGVIYAVLYYVLFRFMIRIFNLKTPGREDEEDETANAAEEKGKRAGGGEDELARQVLEAIGGKENIEHLDACITRLRMTLKNEEKLDRDQLRKLGASGVIQVGPGNFQAVFGTKSELLKERILEIAKQEKAEEAEKPEKE
jgi:PTS system N-acetylglucosamine-specific IIC component